MHSRSFAFLQDQNTAVGGRDLKLQATEIINNRMVDYPEFEGTQKDH